MYKINSESIGDVKKYVWHFRKDNNEYGPFTYEDIIEKVKKGEIAPSDYVLKFGNRKFIKASEVQGLFDEVVQTEEKKEEQIEASEEQLAVSKEDTKEELHVVFDNRAAHLQAKHKQKALSPKLAMVIAIVAGLFLAVFILVRLL